MLSISPAASFSTATALKISNRTSTLGQNIEVKAVVTSSGGSTAGGTVELLDGKKDTGFTGTINHLGYYVFDIGPGNALSTGTHNFRIRYLTHGEFVGSVSRNLTATVKSPSYATQSDGLELATVTAGTGTAIAKGQTAVVEYTGFYASSNSVFDQSANHSPGTFSFTVESSPEQVITGFDQEVLGMKVGETRVAVIPSALGYDDGQVRIFVVHLVSIS